MYSPERYAALEALARGPRTAEEVARELDLEPHDAEALLASLMAAGLVERRERGLIFKREAYALTPQGWRALAEWRQRAREDLQRAARLREEGREEEADAVLAAYASVLPALLALNAVDLALWTALAEQAQEGADAFDEAADEL